MVGAKLMVLFLITVSDTPCHPFSNDFKLIEHHHSRTAQTQKTAERLCRTPWQLLTMPDLHGADGCWGHGNTKSATCSSGNTRIPPSNQLELEPTSIWLQQTATATLNRCLARCGFQAQSAATSAQSTIPSAAKYHSLVLVLDLLWRITELSYYCRRRWMGWGSWMKHNRWTDLCDE